MSTPPLPALDALAFSKLRIHETTPTEGTGKRKIDGSYADTRLGKALSHATLGEREISPSNDARARVQNRMA